MNRSHFLIAASLLLLMPSAIQAREWSDATGKYKVKAELLAHSETTVVLEKKNHDLVSLNISELSPADQEYLKSQEAAEATAAAWAKHKPGPCAAA